MIRVSISKKIVLSSFLLVLYPIVNGFRISSDIEAQNSAVLTYPKIQSPPSLLPSRQILVGIEPYLGKSVLSGSLSKNLDLISDGKPLVLKDALGRIYKSSQISIGWKKILLDSPQRYERQVIGPFSSFESANNVSKDLINKGIQNIIVHPDNWEIWISKDIRLPESIQSKFFNTQISYEVKPVLLLKTGELVLKGPININAPDGLNWKKGVYEGPFLLKRDSYGTWTLIEKTPLENYLKGVVPHEIGPSSPFSAKAAQAVLARTWAVANSSRFSADGYHLCSDTQCQVYKNPNQADLDVLRAIRETSNKILTWKGEPIHAVYHATNGGIMASADEAWSINPKPYLKSKLDGSKRWVENVNFAMDNNAALWRFLSQRDGAYGNNHYRFRWTRKLSSLDLKNFLTDAGFKPLNPQNIKVIKRGPSGRVVTLEITGKNSQSSVFLNRDAIRRIIKSLPSTLFVVSEVDDGVWEFKGGGFGHGAGLSQAGAIDLALRGWSVKQILQHYYPGTTYESLR